VRFIGTLEGKDLRERIFVVEDRFSLDVVIFRENIKLGTASKN